jgi:GntR family transcriptional regulator
MNSRPASTKKKMPALSKPALRDAHASATLMNSRSPVPLYHRLYVLLRERIVNGTYQIGRILPTETELMQTFGVSRITVQRALNDLAEEGLVQRSRGRGTTVTGNAKALRLGTPIAASIDRLFANLTAISEGTTVEVKQLEYIPANEYIAKQLGIEAGVIVQHAARIRHLRDQPFSYSRSFLLEAVGRQFGPESLIKKPMIDLILDSGINIARVQQAISSTLADDVSAGMLKVEIGSPLLKLRRIFLDETERAVNYAEILYSPDRFEYRMTWTRGANDQLELDTSGNASPR